MNVFERGLRFLTDLLWNRMEALQKPLLKLNVDFLYTEIILAEEVVNAIKILRGIHKNVVYYYGHIQVVPEGESHRLAYQYTVWDSAGHSKEDLKKSHEFTTLMGDVLVAIIADDDNAGEYVTPKEQERILDSEVWVEEPTEEPTKDTNA